MTTWVLLRGLTREAAHWNGFEQLLAQRLGTAHRIVTLDMPGNGSEWRETSPWSVPALVHACQARLVLRGTQPPYVLVAMSLGAMVALEWAHRYPRQLAGAVLVNTSARGSGAPWERLRPSAMARLIGMLRPGLPAAQREARILALTSNTPQQHASVAAQWTEIARLRPVHGGNALRQLVAGARYTAPVAAPPVRVLMLASAGDRLVSPECSRRLATRWGFELHIHPTAGHDLTLDDPHWALEQIALWWVSGR